LGEALKEAAEETKVLYGSDIIHQNTIEKISTIRSTIDSCIDATAPQTIVRKDLPMYRVLTEARSRGVKLRYITNITKENISYCKELMKFSELRHLDGIKGNFGLGDRSDFRASTSIFEGQPPTELIVSTVRFFVEQQQYFFDMLWGKAIPAKQRIKEIEQGTKREFVETFREPSETQQLFLNLLKSAKEEILLFFSTANAYYRVERLGLLSLLIEAISRHSINIRVLVPMDNTIQEIITERFSSETGKQVNFHFFNKSTQPKITTLIVDTEYSLNIDTNDDSKQTFNEAVGLSTYSNSESTVAAYTSIFESLWIQSELKEHTELEMS
jgi:hypothetical protein